MVFSLITLMIKVRIITGTRKVRGQCCMATILCPSHSPFGVYVNLQICTLGNAQFVKAV